MSSPHADRRRGGRAALRGPGLARAFRLGALGCALLGCLEGGAGAAYVARGGLLWHPQQRVGVPDLSASGWRPVRLDEADLAFRKEGHGVIAVRTRCPAQTQALRWESRDLWLGIQRSGETRREAEIDGYPALETRAEADDLSVRTLVIRTDECVVDLAHVASGEADAEAVFEGFVEGVRVGGAP